MKLMIISWICLAVGVLGTITGLIGFYGFGLETDTGWWMQRACWLMLGLAFTVPISILMIDWGISVHRWFTNLRQRRIWGYLFGIPGAMIVCMSPGPYKHENDMPEFLVAAGIGFGLMLLAWVINHWPSTRHQRPYRH